MDIDRLRSLVRGRGRVVTIVLLFVGLVGARNWVVTPHLASLQASQQYESATSERLEKSRAVNRQLQARRTDLERLAGQHAVLSEGVFSPSEAEAFLGGLEAFCEQSGCAVASLGFPASHASQPGDDESSLRARGAVLSVHGTYVSATRLIERLQARREKVWIDRLRITALGPDTGRVACHLTITIYVNRHEENVDHANGPIRD